MLTYAGIGARTTPPAILENIRYIAAWLARAGWHLHTSGAAGADTVFARSTPSRQKPSGSPGVASEVTRTGSAAPSIPNSSPTSPSSPPWFTQPGIAALPQHESSTPETSRSSSATCRNPRRRRSLLDRERRDPWRHRPGHPAGPCVGHPGFNLGHLQPFEVCRALDKIRSNRPTDRPRCGPKQDRN